MNMIPLLLCLLGAAGMGVAHAGEGQATSRSIDADFARGLAQAKADFARGRGGWYFHHYSNMPNGPDDPVLARKRDLLVALLMKNGIEPKDTNSGCIPVPGLSQFASGYNSIARARLEAKFGANYLTLWDQEVARRMRAPRPATSEKRRLPIQGNSQNDQGE